MAEHHLILGHGTTIVDPVGGLVTPFGGSAVLKVAPQMLRNGNAPYHGELQYLGLLQELVDKTEGAVRDDRTGTGTFSVFGRQIRFNLAEGFPLLTTKKLFTRGIVAELLWMLAGETNIQPLLDQNVHIWDEWADKDGNLGPIYGKQWRSWEGVEGHIDQITQAIETLKTNPTSRRILVSAWNPADLPRMALSPCHCLFQFYVDDGKLSCQLYQRSADIFLGVPFNIASYALLTHLMAREAGLEVGEFIHTFGDLHLYSNHVEQAKEQLTRTPRPFPQLFLQDDTVPKSIFEWVTKDVEFLNYDPHPAIQAEVSI